MKLRTGVYQARLEAGPVKIVVGSEAEAAAIETWLKSQRVQALGRIQGGNMPQYSQTIRPITGADGPWWLVSRNPDGSDFNVTTGVATVGAALDQAKTDGAAILSAASGTPKNIDIFTTF